MKEVTGQVDLGGSDSEDDQTSVVSSGSYNSSRGIGGAVASRGGAGLDDLSLISQAEAEHKSQLELDAYMAKLIQKNEEVRRSTLAVNGK